MTYEEALIRAKETLEEATSTESAVCYVTSFDKEWLEQAIKALEKQIPKKVTDIHCDEYYCPNCGSENNCDQYIVGDNFCPNCGQAIDWDE